MLYKMENKRMVPSVDKKVVLALMGAAALGVGGCIAYSHYKKQSEASSDTMELEVELEQAHITWLDGIAAKYTSGDRVKALHMLVEHCKSADDTVAETIFKKIRCKTCGKKDKAMHTVTLSKDHASFINAASVKYEISGGQDKALRVMFEYVINVADEVTVFGG